MSANHTDFAHEHLPHGHVLAPHVLYSMNQEQYIQN